MKKLLVFTFLLAFALPAFSYLFDIGDSKGKKEVDSLETGQGLNQQRIKSAQKLENLKRQADEVTSVGLMPFKDLSKVVKGDRTLHRKMKKALEKEGFNVSSFRTGRKIRWKENVSNFETLRNKDIADIGRENGFDYMIVGTINKISAKKKFKLGNFLTFPIGLGKVLYGEVDFRIRAVRTADGKEIYKNEFFNKRKNQLGGIYQGSGAVLNRNFKELLQELIEELKPMLK